MVGAWSFIRCRAVMQQHHGHGCHRYSHAPGYVKTMLCMTLFCNWNFVLSQLLVTLLTRTIHHDQSHVRPGCHTGGNRSFTANGWFGFWFGVSQSTCDDLDLLTVSL